MKKSMETVFRILFLFVYIFSMAPAQNVSAASVEPVANSSGIPVPAQQVIESKAAPGPAPAKGGYKVASQEQFKAREAVVVASKPVTLDGSATQNRVNPTGGLFAPLGITPAPQSSYSFFDTGVPGADLTIEPITAYNLIVDSNVLSSSSYGPNAATLGAKYCNTSGASMSDVWAYIGDFNPTAPTSSTPGVYPAHEQTDSSDADTPDPDFVTHFDHLVRSGETVVAVDYGDPSRFFAFEQEAGSVSDTQDASRYLGTLAAGECRTVYWLVSYPRKVGFDDNDADTEVDTWVDITDGIKPEDDLWLEYDFWGKVGTNYSYYTRFATMRNEISAMANKIWPNGDNKVPEEYVRAISDVLGWDTWTPSDPTGGSAFPGETVRSQGIWYDFGNVGAGFDNNYDFTPDRNAWVQPIGDAGTFDPGCFRLVRTYGLVIVKLNDGTELLIPFVDQMYFENIPGNNTGAVGLVYYEYIAMDGACTAALTPYQEVASGYDNEKFNADFGAGIPPLTSKKSTITLDKTANANSFAINTTYRYSLTFTLPDLDAGTSTTITIGNPSSGLPLTYYDEVPIGMDYIDSSDIVTLVQGGVTTTPNVTKFYSNDGGTTWSSTEPASGTESTVSNQIVIRWQLQSSLSTPNGASSTGTVWLDARVHTGSTLTSITNEACLTFGTGPGFVCDPITNQVRGTGAINGLVWRDNGISTNGVLGDGMQNNTNDPGEGGIQPVTISLYWDNDGDGNYTETGDFKVGEVQSMNYSTANGYIQSGGSNVTLATLFNDVTIRNGLLDLNNDGSINGSDSGNFGGYPVTNGLIDVNGATAGYGSGTLVGVYHFGNLPAVTGSARYAVAVDYTDSDIPAGYGSTTPVEYTKINLTTGLVYGDGSGEYTDFGFAPALSVNKILTSSSPTTIGQPVQFQIAVTNNLPGNGSSSGSSCTYVVWPGAVHQDDTSTKPDGGNTNSKWWYNDNLASGSVGANYVQGPPDNRYIRTDLTSNADEIGLMGFNLGYQGGNITSVRYVFYVKELNPLQSGDNLELYLYYDHDNNPATEMLSVTNSETVPFASWLDMNAIFPGTAGYTSTVTSADLSWAAAGSVPAKSTTGWTWADFTDNRLGVKFWGKGGGGGSGNIAIDAVGFQITTDAPCGGGNNTILNPVPLTDTYDNTMLTYVSASLPPSSGPTPSGSSSTLTWSNVGPLYPGQTKNILVDFTAKAVTSPNTLNTASSSGAKFASGRNANDDADTNTTDDTDNDVPVVINTAGSISGTVWADANNSGWDAGTTGITSGEKGLPGVTVNLYACRGSADTYVTSSASGYASGSNCAGQDVDTNNSGTWDPIATQTTDANGYYSFAGLVPGFYYVEVNSASLPTGFTTQRAEPLPNGSGQACANCNNGWEPISGTSMNTYISDALNFTASDTTTFNELTSGENITNVNFGYTGSPVVSGTIWQDFDGDGTRDADPNNSNTFVDAGILNVTVTLRNCGADVTCASGTTVTTTTDANGYYEFTGLSNSARYAVYITFSSLPGGATGWSQTYESTGGATETPNNLILIGVVSTNQTYVKNDQGWTKSDGYSIGDTLYYDWNGNSDQNTGASGTPVEEGIPNMDVLLYRDLDQDGVLDATDPLARTVPTTSRAIVNGSYDSNYSGVGDSSDNATDIWGTAIDVYGGRFDVNNDGYGNDSDNGYILGIAVVNGYLDIDDDGAVVVGGDPDDDLAIGSYRFNNVPGGTGYDYIVKVNLGDTDFPPGVSQTDDPDETGICVVCNSQSYINELMANNLNQDFGYKPTGTGKIGDTVFKDINGDGSQGSVEPGLNGVPVELQVDMNGDGTYVTILSTATATSAGGVDGYYLFAGLRAGTYRVVVKTTTSNDSFIPNDAMSGLDYVNTNNILDSTTGNVYKNVTLATSTSTDLNADFGFGPLAYIGDTVYKDINGNGTQDFNESGISSAVVTLYTFVDAGDGDGVYDTGEPFMDLDNDSIHDSNEPFYDKDGRYQPGETITSTGLTDTTDANGKYEFMGLAPAVSSSATSGYYVVGVTAPPSGTLTADPSGDGVACASITYVIYPGNGTVCDARDGMRLYPGTVYTGADFGYQPAGSFGDTLWIDTDNDGIVDVGEKGISYVDIQLYIYADVNANNVYDAGTDTLGALQATATTDINGNYYFANIADNTGNNKYLVRVNTSDTDISGLITAGLANTYDPDGTNNSETTVVIASGAVSRAGSCTSTSGCTGEDNNDPLYLDVDFGYDYSGSGNLSGTVCLDSLTTASDANGVNDPLDEVGVCGNDASDPNGVDTTSGQTEVAYNNVTVYLYKWTDDGDGAIESGETVQIASTITNASGDYSFSNIPQGIYYIIAIGSPQSGLELTSQTDDSPEVGDDAANKEIVVESNPSGTDLSAYQVVQVPASGDMTIENVDFAYTVSGSYDFGDLPDSYSTTLQGTPDGARHLVPSTPNLYLGSAITPPIQADLVEVNGQPSAYATGDGSDEDGVTIITTDSWSDGIATLQFDVVGSGWLMGWIDRNNDGDFADANEVIVDQSISAGQNQNITVTNAPTADGTYNMRFRLFSSEPPVAALAYSGAANNGEVEDYHVTLSGGTPTPVSLSYFRAQRNGSTVNFEWSTATETGNLGFNLYVEERGKLIKINNDLIPTSAVDSLIRQDYSFSMDLAGDTFFIEDVSTSGEPRQHGPFQLGEKYGDQLEGEKIDRNAIQTEHIEKSIVHQDELKKNLKVPAVAMQAPNGSQVVMQLTTSLNLKVNKTGIYRVTYEMLRNAGLDLAGVPDSKITLTNHGQMVPIYVEGKGKFGPSAFIEFYGEALDTIYTDTNVYTLQISQSPATRVQTNSALPGKGHVSPLSYTDTITVNNQRAYANYAPGSEPWYDTRMLVFKTPQTWNFNFQLSDVNAASPATLDLVVLGITLWPQAPDHHLKVAINGVSLADETFDGLVEKTLKLNLPAGILREGTNTLQLFLPADMGVDSDLINLDKFSVTYQRAYKAQNGRLTFTETSKAFNVTNLPSANVIVYRLNQKEIIRLARVDVQRMGSTFTASFAGSNQLDTYLVVTAESLYAPILEATRLDANLSQPAQYLIISHPSFINGLQPLIQARQVQGLTVSVVDVTDLYTQYNYGVFDPQAIKDYIAYAKQNLGTEYVLLVGGDTYDYRNYLGKNSISFIPSIYINPSVTAKFVPADPVYADVNSDNLPDLAIGRFPVRTANELDMLISKTLAYANKDYHRTAVFASDANDGIVSYKNISAGLQASLPSGWTTKNIHLDDISLTAARTQLITAMNKGSALITYTGHSAPTIWSLNNLFTTKDAAGLTNIGRPFVVVQWGCWNTYYVDPVNKYLVQSFLFSGKQGAAAVFGSITITDSESEQLLGALLTPRLATPGIPMGKALQEAKLELAQTHPELLDVILGWTLMGDPALLIEP